VNERAFGDELNRVVYEEIVGAGPVGPRRLRELLPGRVGAVSGLFFGFAFGMGGVGAALLGKLADYTNINFVYQVCSFLPAIGILTAFLPDLGPARVVAARKSAN
jgi:hypothetical protein